MGVGNKTIAFGAFTLGPLVNAAGLFLELFLCDKLAFGQAGDVD